MDTQKNQNNVIVKRKITLTVESELVDIADQLTYSMVEFNSRSYVFEVAISRLKKDFEKKDLEIP